MIQTMNYKIKFRNLYMKPSLSLLPKTLVKLSEVVERMRDAKMVGFDFNIAYLFLFHIHLHLCCLWPRGLSHSFFFCEKSTPRFITYFILMGALKGFWVTLFAISTTVNAILCSRRRKLFLLWPSCFFHRNLCHIDIIFFFSWSNPLFSFLFCIIWLQVFNLTIVPNIFLLCNITLHIRQMPITTFSFFLVFLSYLFCLKQHFFFLYFLMDNLEEQDDYVVLSSIHNAYNNDMAILKAFETFASIYTSSKILINVSSTKMVSFLWKKWENKDLVEQA